MIEDNTMAGYGNWWFKSESDKRYNGSGYGAVSMWGPPREAEEQLGALEKKYGKAPEDLEWGFVKD